MTYLIRSISILFGTFFLLSIQSCNLFDQNTSTPCEHEIFKGHWLELPVSFVPYKQIYNIGDTVEVNMTFPDSIYDFGTEQTFKIENLPLRPISSLYRIFGEDQWDSGLRVNELILDTIKYEFLYQQFGIISDNLRANHSYNEEENLYEFSYQIVLNEPGVYLFYTMDYNTYNTARKPDQMDQEHFAKVNEVDFEGKCNATLEFLYTLQHDGHYTEYNDELLYLDQTIVSNNFSAIDSDLGLGNGAIRLDRVAFFCFEVIE